MCVQLGQTVPIQTMDQHLNAMAQQVKWSKAAFFEIHYVRLGGFHALCVSLPQLGNCWEMVVLAIFQWTQVFTLDQL